jgi:hypothetical protein
MDYKIKYLKYKSKYLELKKQIGASNSPTKHTRKENREIAAENRKKEREFMENYRKSHPEEESSFLNTISTLFNINKKNDINPTEILKEKDAKEKKDAEQDAIDNEKDVNKMLTRIKNIEKVPIEDGKLKYTYNGYPYNNDYGTSNINKLKEVTIPESITYIENNAFTHNLLTEINIPKSIQWIGQLAFAFNKLKSVNIPDSVKHIHDNAFANNNLESVTIPNSVTYIGRNAFANNNLTSVIIPKSVIIIEHGVFNNNPNLKTITISDDLKITNYKYFTDSKTPVEISIIK